MTHENNLSRTGVTLPSHLLENFDQIISQRGYSSRSEGVRDAIRSYITHYTWMSEVKGERHGVITMVYDQDHQGIIPVINDIQYEFQSIIEAALHSHVSQEQVLEIILVKGEGTQIKTLTERLMSLKGVESVKLTAIQT